MRCIYLFTWVRRTPWGPIEHICLSVHLSVSISGRLCRFWQSFARAIIVRSACRCSPWVQISSIRPVVCGPYYDFCICNNFHFEDPALCDAFISSLGYEGPRGVQLSIYVCPSIYLSLYLVVCVVFGNHLRGPLLCAVHADAAHGFKYPEWQYNISFCLSVCPYVCPVFHRTLCDLCICINFQCWVPEL